MPFQTWFRRDSKSESLSYVMTHQNPDFCKTSSRINFARTKSGGLPVDIPSLYLPKVHDCVLGRLDAGEILGINRWPMWNTAAVNERDFAPRAPLLLPHLISHQRHPSRSTMKVNAGTRRSGCDPHFPYLTALLVILGRKQTPTDSRERPPLEPAFINFRAHSTCISKTQTVRLSQP